MDINDERSYDRFPCFAIDTQEVSGLLGFGSWVIAGLQGSDSFAFGFPFGWVGLARCWWT